MAVLTCRDCGRIVSESATACSLCGVPTARPGVKRALLVLLTSTLAVLVVAGIYQVTAAIYGMTTIPDVMEAMPAASAQPTSAGPAREITADQLQLAYAENAVTADGDFMGARLTVSGVVNDIRTDSSQSAYIVFSTSNGASEPQALLLKSQLSAAARLKAGTPIRVSCVGIGNVANTPMLKDCSIDADVDGASDRTKTGAAADK